MFGRVFGIDHFKVFLWWEANTLAITASNSMYLSEATTPFDIKVGVVCIVTTSGRVSDWLGLA